MNHRSHTLTIALATISFIAGIATPVDASATLLLPKVPLFVNLSTTPNIFLEMDDSGSMNWDILVPTYFTTCRYNKLLGCTTLESNGEFYDWTGQTANSKKTYATFEYVLDSPDDTYSTACTGQSRETIQLCTTGHTTTLPWDWRVKSSSLNVLWFNPAVSYLPWPGKSNASFSAARSYPDSSQSTGYNATRNLANLEYFYWIDNKGFTGSQPDNTDSTTTPNGIVDQWDSNVRVVVNSGSYTCTLYNYAPSSSGLNPTTSSLSLSDSRCVAAVGINTTAAKLAQNVANWYQYYRRRSMVARAGISTVVNNLPEFRYGLSMINATNVFVEMPPSNTVDFTAHNTALVKEYVKLADSTSGTPLQRGLENVGRYYDNDLSGRTSPIVLACQKNFALLFTDGYWNGANPVRVTTDVDKDNGVVFQGTGSETRVLLADVAKYYYDKDLSPMANLVPTDKFDSASHQHMVTMSLGFGVTGSLTDTDGDGWPNDFNPETYKNPWYLSGATDNEKTVDDLWHAAWNSRGQYFSSKNPQHLIDDLESAIESIGDRIGGAASGATNGGSISSESKIFQAKFDALDWHGSLLAINVTEENGKLGTIEWEAGDILDQKSRTWFTSTRKVITYNTATHAGAAFTWTGLSTAQKALLNINPKTGATDTQGQARLDYIRGSDEHEAAGNNYRERDHQLGDIGHSDPEYVGWPPFYYPFGNYQTFAETNKNRAAMVYVGANDGMLHGFRESDGEEILAYIPDKLISKLNLLTDTGYNHEFYVDGSPVYGDVEIGQSWKSVLIGALRGGSQGLYALDVTSPTTFAGSNVMWEFTDANDADLGLVYGEPQIRKMANGKWAAVFSSGYNNTASDGYVSPNGDQYIYILYIEDGINGWVTADYKKIKITGADGLAGPAVADIDGDYIADFIYVGDLNGKMWKIDVTSSNPSSWAVAFGGEPLFVAENEDGYVGPITTRPAIMRHPLSISEGVLVLVGTGKYLEVADDSTDRPVQSIYAVWDRDGYYNKALNQRNSYGEHNFTRDDLEHPEIDVDVESNTRVIHDYAPNTPIWFNEEGEPESRGWVVDLPEAGERIVREIVLRDDTAFFVTLIPAEDPCAAGGKGWLMALNASTGAAPRFPVWDLNDDSVIDETDSLSIGNPLDPDEPDGIVNPVGTEMLSMPNLPTFLYDDRASDLGGVFPPRANAPRGCGMGGAKSFTYTTKTNGSITMIAAAHQPMSCGRQSWFQTD